MVAADGPSRTDFQAVSRTSQILALFNVNRSELVTAEVAVELGLNRTTAHRYLTSMASAGLLGPGSRHSTYVVGPLATRLGAIATGSAAVLGIAPRHMLAVSDELSVTIALSLWASTGPMVVHVAEPRTADALLTVRVGTVLPVDTAQGVLFAAFLPPELSHAAKHRARLDPATRRIFDENLAQAKETGLVVTRRREVGVVVAAPVFDDDGLCATVAAVGLADSTFESGIAEHSQRVRDLAARLTDRLGGRPLE